jgi:hypothetical protein
MRNRFRPQRSPGILLIDLARRSIVTWYALLLLFPLTSGVASVAINWLQIWVSQTSMLNARLLFALAGSRPDSSLSAVFPLFVGINAIPFVAGAVIALVLTLGCRMIAGLSLVTRDALRDFLANLVGATIWIALVFGGAFALSHWSKGYSLKPSSWMLLSSAVAVALAATLSHLEAGWV